MVISIGDTELLAEIPETVVNPTLIQTDVIHAYNRFTQYVGAKVVGPIDHPIFQAGLIERIEKQFKGVNYGVILIALRYSTV